MTALTPRARNTSVTTPSFTHTLPSHSLPSHTPFLHTPFLHTHPSSTPPSFTHTLPSRIPSLQTRRLPSRAFTPPPSQVVPASSLASLPRAKDLVEGLIPYAERHFERIDKLL
eukprot:scaffold9938_cov56-Isochrysis_galbana.AAC.1